MISRAATPSEPAVDAIREAVTDRLNRVEDPELPIPIAELGMLRDVVVEARDEGAAVSVTLTPTFLGCPARFLIESNVRSALETTPGVSEVHLRWVAEGEWDPSRISPDACEILAGMGVAVPGDDGDVACPYCGAGETRIESSAGSTLCRVLAYCPTCRNPFEFLRTSRVHPAGPVTVLPRRPHPSGPD